MVFFSLTALEMMLFINSVGIMENRDDNDWGKKLRSKDTKVPAVIKQLERSIPSHNL